MNLLGYNVPPVALGLAGAAAAGFVAIDAFGGRIAPPAWRRPAAVAPECSLKFFPALHHGGTRKASALTLVVLHSTEGPTAESAAGWFQSPDSKGSTHIVLGEGSGSGVCYRCLDDLTEPWGAAGANHNGLHVEFTGYAKWSRDEWLQRPAMLALGRAQVLSWCAKYNIPVRYVDAAGLKAGRSGITTHVDITRAFAGGVGHYDPGPNFPRDVIGVAGHRAAPPTGLVGALLGA